jgi:hypothetical protein
MTWGLKEAGSVIVKLAARAIVGSAEVVGLAATGTLCVAEFLLELLNCRLCDDLGRWKEAMLREREARSSGVAAEAQEKLARAMSAANFEIQERRRDEEARAAAELKKAEAGKVRAEAQRIKAEARKTGAETERVRVETELKRREAAVAAAKENVLEKLSSLRQEGGELIINSENLTRIMGSAAALQTVQSAAGSAHLKFSVSGQADLNTGAATMRSGDEDRSDGVTFD